MGSLPKGKYSPTSHHLSLLQTVTKTSSGSAQHFLIRSYERSFNGFAAMLSDNEAKQLQSSKEMAKTFLSLMESTQNWLAVQFFKGVLALAIV
ncbi:Subtilisin-like protease SBT4.3 [Euphorbia peplus]|nr:Subtilisin-like protease SBT4.3 [Euphorbia peplus]